MIYVGLYWYIMVHHRITQFIAVLVCILKIQKISIILGFRTQDLSHTYQHTQPLCTGLLVAWHSARTVTAGVTRTVSASVTELSHSGLTR
jgi:hypothetical protein